MGDGSTIIDALLARHGALAELLVRQREPSLKLDAEDSFKRFLVIACASFFEAEIVSAIKAYARARDVPLAHFIERRILDRGYSTLFRWDGQNVNEFLGLFGESFKDAARGAIDRDEALQAGMRRFLSMGELRNRLVHGNAVTAPIDWTVEELAGWYRSAWSFVRFLGGRFAAGAPETAAPAPLHR